MDNNRNICKRKRGKTIHSETRQMIANVIKACDEEKKEGQFYKIGQSTERAAYYTGHHRNTITKIRKECQQSPNGMLSTPGKSRPHPVENTIASVDSFDRQVIRNLIEDFYLRQKVVPTTKKLLPVLREKIEFTWSTTSLRKILKEMGFRWTKTQSRRRVLTERQDILLWRYRYLKSIKSLRDENRHIYYLDETWVDSNLTFKKCWQGDSVSGIISKENASNRLIVVSIGSIEGFLEDTTLIFKAGIASGDYHGQMNNVNFEKWIREKVLIKLKPNSVVVMDNAPYHNLQTNKVPTMSQNKKVMMEWLEKNKIEYDRSMRKIALFDLISLNAPKEKRFKIDELLKENGHTVIRTPPYMCELNPIELAWAQMKRYIRDRNTTGDLSTKNLELLTNDAVKSVTRQNWAGFIKHVLDIEESFRKTDGILTDTVDEFIISLGGCQENDSANESDSDGSDSELATPLEQ